jgi:hypothetical protein
VHRDRTFGRLSFDSKHALHRPNCPGVERRIDRGESRPLGADVAEVTLTVRQSTLRSLDSHHGTTVTGGFRTQAYVSLDGQAPEGGILVQLSSRSTAVTLPASVLIPEGAVSGSFEVTTVSVAAITEVVLSASSGSVTVSLSSPRPGSCLRLHPVAPSPDLARSRSTGATFCRVTRSSSPAPFTPWRLPTWPCATSRPEPARP